jgi:hypothetical protein
MKKPDLVKQLANRINQPHVIESWINKIEKAAYKKGYADAQNEQCNIAIVSKSVAKQYAEFCVRCDREGLPLLELDDYIKQYCC